MTQQWHSWIYTLEKWKLIFTPKVCMHVHSHSSYNQPKLERTQMLFSRWRASPTSESYSALGGLYGQLVSWVGVMGEKWSCFLQLIKIPDKMRFLWYYKYEKTCKLFTDACVSPTVCIWVCYVSVLSTKWCRFWRSRGVNYVNGRSKRKSACKINESICLSVLISTPGLKRGVYVHMCVIKKFF